MTVKKVFLYSIIGFFITALVFTGVFYFATSNESDAEVSKEIETFTHPIGELYSNLKESKRIVKINMVLETNDEKFIKEIESRNSKINNCILELLRSKREEDLEGEMGQKNLRKEILGTIKTILPSEKVSDIYFIEFIIQ